MYQLDKIQYRIIYKRLFSILADIFIFGVSIYIGLSQSYDEFTSGTFGLYFAIIYFFVNVGVLFFSKNKQVGDIYARIKLVPLRKRHFFKLNILRILLMSLQYFAIIWIYEIELLVQMLMAVVFNGIIGGLFFSSPDKNSLVTLSDKIFGSYYVEDKLNEKVESNLDGSSEINA